MHLTILKAIWMELEAAWKSIFSEWLPASGYQYAESVDMECFPNEGNRGAEDFNFEIWLPVVNGFRRRRPLKNRRRP